MTVQQERDMQAAHEEVIDFGAYIAIFRRVWWKAGIVSLLAGIATFLFVSRLPNVYTAAAVIAPPAEENKQPRFLGALSSIGIEVGGASKVEDLEVLFKSDDLAVRVFSKYKVWPIVLADRYDPVTGTIKSTWLDQVVGRQKTPKTPIDWDAIRVTKQNLKVVINKKAGALSLAFESPSAAGSANIVRYFLEEGKNRLQEEALSQTARNRKFIEEQIARTLDPLARDRMYAMFSQEMEKEMLARNREQFGFRIIDSVRVPDQKTGPSRGRTIVGAMFLSFMVFFVVAIAIRRGEK